MTTLNLEAEKSAVKAMLDQYIASVEKGDVDLWSRTFVHEPDLVYIGTDAADYIVGWNALREAFLAQKAALTRIKITQSQVTIHVSPEGQFAWAISFCDLKATMGEQAIELSVRCTDILEKRESGWMIVHSHHSAGMTD